MDYDHHGGQCCGVSHVFNFSHDPDKQLLLRCINNAIEYIQEGVDEANEDDIENDNPPSRPYRGPFGHLIEVVLTDDQMVIWAKTLKEEGFKLHRRWLNDNSGNYCNLLSWIPKEPSKPRPYKW